MITIDRGVPILPERSYSTTVSEAEPPINKLPGLKLYHISYIDVCIHSLWDV